MQHEVAFGRRPVPTLSLGSGSSRTNSIQTALSIATRQDGLFADSPNVLVWISVRCSRRSSKRPSSALCSLSPCPSNGRRNSSMFPMPFFTAIYKNTFFANNPLALSTLCDRVWSIFSTSLSMDYDKHHRHGSIVSQSL
jgi:hypothetical protein